jgi:carboxypeptidase family protein
LEVLPLSSLRGTVSGPVGAPLEGILIRLSPGNRYTSTSADGHFSFYNLPEGDFDVVLDQTSLADNERIASPLAVPVMVRWGSPSASIDFALTVQTTAKPIRKVLELK